MASTSYCKKFNTAGGCKYGGKCNFKHPTHPCKHHAAGHCSKGTSCTYSHQAHATDALVQVHRNSGNTRTSARHGGGATNQRVVTSRTMETRVDGTVIATETMTKQVIWTPYGAFAGQTRFAKSIKRDTFGNAAGPIYDLSPDNTFKGEQIAILQLYV